MISYNAKLRGIQEIETVCTKDEQLLLYKQAADWYFQEFEKFKSKFQTPEQEAEFLEALAEFNQERA